MQPVDLTENFVTTDVMKTKLGRSAIIMDGELNLIYRADKFMPKMPIPT